MFLGEIVRVAIEAVLLHKLRSFLTMLGIIIGVGAMITMVALGTGAQRSVEERIQALGPTLLSVFPGQSFMGRVASEVRVSLTLDDAEALARDGRHIDNVVPEMQRNMQIARGNQNFNLNVIGTTPNYASVRSYTITAGRMFTPGDDEGQRRVVVLGSAVPDMMNSNPLAMIGQEIQIAGVPFEIVGVLSEKGGQGSFQNPDEQVLIPLHTARYRVMGTDRLRSMTAQAASVDDINGAMLEIERVLRREHKIRPGEDNDFNIRRQADVLSTFQQTTQTFTFLLAGISAVSLLVGGIGIMNIMLVSVTERTREIGIRKALGAKRSAILFQFLVEALSLCFVGGMLGILFGWGGALLLAKLAHWNTFVSPVAILLAFGFSAVVGLFFGLWPARRAASLDPILALRYE
jgi:putative ABC transport system permease protein